jgi:hypothetical protein
VEGIIDVGTVAGYAAAVRIKAATGEATIRGKVTADEVGASGQIIGVDIDSVGDA